jgi:endonuclease/exonuclease/phosphatase family metal-dependent hydrolase
VISQAELPRDRGALQLALLAITMALGLQLLRLLFVTGPNPFGVYQEWLDGELRGSYAITLGVFGLVVLAPLVARALGARRALWVTVGGVALARLAVQLVPHPVARLLLAGLGVLLLVWSVPILVGVLHGRPTGRWLGPGLVAGLAVDTALHVTWGAWDAAWSVDPVAIAAAAALAAVVVVAVARLLAEDLTARAGILGDRRIAVGDRWAATALPLVGLGPALFLQALLWQNVAAQSVLLGRPQPWAFLLVMLANLLALLTAVAAASIPGRPAGDLRPLPMVGVPVGWLGWLVTLAAAAGLLVAVVVERRAPLAGLFLGQAAAAALLGRIGRSAAGRAAGAGVGRVTVAWGGGMLLFGTLMLAYYLAYERRVPYDNRWLLPLAAAIVGAAGLAAQRSLGRESRRGSSAPASLPLAPGGPRVLPWSPVVLGIGLLVFPIGLQLGAPAATTSTLGYPVRMMAYNVHGGFDDDGRMNLRAIAADIRASHAEVVGLEEVARGGYTTGSVDMLAWLQRRLRLPYAVYAGESDPGLGNAIVSRRPILASGVGRLPGGRMGRPRRNGYLWADVDLGAGQTVRVIVTHLTSLSADQGGSAVRVRQVARLLAVWAGHPATLLVGDLNATPDSPEIGLLRQAGLQDAWLAAAGRPTDELTLPVNRPAERIDYLWLTADLRATEFRATSSTASDHRGVSVTLQPRVTR